jgi:hypothetical protein
MEANKQKRTVLTVLSVAVALLLGALLLCRVYATDLLFRGIVHRFQPAVRLALALKPEAANEERLGRPILFYAIAGRNEAAVESLLSRGADPGADDGGSLEQALMTPSRPIIAALLRHEADFFQDIRAVSNAIYVRKERAVLMLAEELTLMGGQEPALRNLRSNLMSFLRAGGAIVPRPEEVQRVVDFIDSHLGDQPPAP